MFFNLHHSQYCLFFQFKMKTSKGHILIKYVVLFSLILVAVVLSTVVAGYVSTRSLVEDIPSQVKMDLQKMPEWKILKRLLSNFSQLKHALQYCKKKYRTQNNALQQLNIVVFFIISILYHIDFKNETKTVNEWLLQRLLNETSMSCT